MTRFSDGIKVFYILLLNISLLLSKVDENPLDNLDHLVLSDRKRIVIDNAVSPTLVNDLLEFCLLEPKIQYVNTSPSFHGEDKFAVIDVNDVFQGIFKSMRHDHSADHNPLAYEIDNSTNPVLSTVLKRIKFMDAAIKVQAQIMDYAETFFNRRFKIKTASVFRRGRVNLENMTYGEARQAGKESDDEVNGGNGWLVSIHCDNCVLSSKWDCDVSPRTWNEQEQEDFTRRHISIVMFLNELPAATGGEFVFVDPDRSRERGPAQNERYKEFMKNQVSNNINQYQPSEPESPDKHKGEDQLKKKGKSHSPPEQLRQQQEYTEWTPLRRRELEHAIGPVIPPPSRAAIRRQLSKARSDATRNAIADTDASIDSRIKSVHVLDGSCNYTVVLPRPGRLVMFNSSVEHVHAVTNLLRQGDQRYTLFMFLTEVRD